MVLVCWSDGGQGLADACRLISVLGRPGGVLLSHGLSRSTMGAEGFHGRVRDGIGCCTLAMATRSSQNRDRRRNACCRVVAAPTLGV